MLYVDPGAGTLLWQLILSFFVGGAFFIGSFLKRLIAKLHLKSKHPTLPDRESKLEI